MEILEQVDNIIKKYNLSNTELYGYSHYNCNSSDGLAKYNKEKYLKLREAFNKKILLGKVEYVELYVLIIYSFNNQIRFLSIF